MFLRYLVLVLFHICTSFSYYFPRNGYFNQVAFTSRHNAPNSPLLMSFGSGIAEKLTGIVELIAGQSTITEKNIEDTLKEIKNILIDADVNLQVANTLISKVKDKAIGMKVESGQKPGEQFISLLASELVDTMGMTQSPLNKRNDGRPSVILLAGLQGAGKTTAVAKLAKWSLKQELSKKILLVAGDIYRPAAIDQLVTLGSRLGIDVYSEGKDVSPVQISRRALSKALTEGYDMVIIDTAGRQVIDDRLMDELKQIKAAVTPDEVLLVVDAMTGQEAATLTARFNDDIGITGAILTKLDGDTRGGSALSVRGVSGKPIKFIGVGEGLDDLEPFYPDRMASRILGMGDIKSFLEKAQSAINYDDATKIGKKMKKGSFDFNDFLSQSQSVRKMGGMGGLLKMIPGMSGKISDEQLFEAEKRLKRSEAIISLMTEEERSNPDLITRQGGSQDLLRQAVKRRNEIAQQSGYDIREIEAFVVEFLNMRKMMVQNLKGINLESPDMDPNTPVPLEYERPKKEKKIKVTRGGGGGFGSK